MTAPPGFAIVTGASSGIGLELARLCAQSGFDVLIAADEPQVHYAASELSAHGTSVTAIQADLASSTGVCALLQAVRRLERPIDVLIANAGCGLGRAFFDQDIQRALRVAHTNIDGTLHLIHGLLGSMVAQGRGRVLITGSLTSRMPGTFQAVYNATTAFLDSFAMGLAAELKGTGVTCTCLLPGPTDTRFFARADMLDTKVGLQESKSDPADVAQTGFDAMLRGELRAAHGVVNKVRAAAARMVPGKLLAAVPPRAEVSRKPKP